MDMVFTRTQIDLSTKATGKTTKCRALGYMNGRMVESTKASGSKIICMEKDLIPGLMEGHTKDHLKTIRGMGSAHSDFLTAEFTRECGLKESSMEKVAS